MKTKEKLIIVLLSIVIAGIRYWFFWDGYYSIDKYRIISQVYTDYELKDASEFLQNNYEYELW